MFHQKKRILVVGLTSAVMLLPALGSLTPASAVPASAPVAQPAASSARTLTISPVAEAANGSVKATFRKSDYIKGRSAVLYRLKGTKWVKVSTVKLASSGVAVFKVSPGLTTTYKAVAGAYKKAAAVETAQASASVASAFSDSFSSPSKNYASAKWSRTRDGDFNVDKRWCSAPKDSNAKVSGSLAKLSMSKANSADTKAAIAAAKEKQKAAGLKVVGCPTGVYYNARVSTEGKFTMKSGIIAARIKFPKAQGSHGGIWVRTAPEAGSELDMVEAFGYKKGIQNVVHIGERDSNGAGVYETKEANKWVAKSAVKKSSWWNKYHVFSMEWNAKKVTFRLDGKVTKTETPSTGIPMEDYYLVMSMLSSDWETGRLTKPVNGGVKAKLPETMQVDWVKAWTPVG